MRLSLNLSFLFLISCANGSLNNTCDTSSKAYAETSALLGFLGQKHHPCYPGMQIVNNPGLNVSSTTGTIAEFGGNALQGSSLSFGLYLGMAPKDPVSVLVIVSNSSYATVSPPSFVWTSSDWSVTKSIAVTAVNDTIINGTRNFSIRLVATSNDSSMRLQDQIISMEIIDNDKIIFTTSGSYTGILGGVFGADAICQADAKCPLGKICKAMLADGGSGVRRASLTAASLFTFPIVGIRPTSATAWTGLSADWTNNGNHCGSWTVNSGNGNAGDTAGTGTAAIGFSSFPCNSNLPFYCVEQ